MFCSLSKLVTTLVVLDRPTIVKTFHKGGESELANRKSLGNFDLRFASTDEFYNRLFLFIDKCRRSTRVKNNKIAPRKHNIDKRAKKFQKERRKTKKNKNIKYFCPTKNFTVCAKNISRIFQKYSNAFLSNILQGVWKVTFTFCF